MDAEREREREEKWVYRLGGPKHQELHSAYPPKEEYFLEGLVLNPHCSIETKDHLKD